MRWKAKRLQKLTFSGHTQIFYKLHKGYIKLKTHSVLLWDSLLANTTLCDTSYSVVCIFSSGRRVADWNCAQGYLKCNTTEKALLCYLPTLKGEESCWLRLFGERMSEHGPDVYVFAGSGGYGECHSSDGLEVEEVDEVHISLLGQPDDEVVCTLDVSLGIGSCRLAWDFLFFFLFFLGDSLLDLFICHLLLVIKGCITGQSVCNIDAVDLSVR